MTSYTGHPYPDGRWLGALATRASRYVRAYSEEQAEEMAIEEWEDITELNPYAEGCPCCGRPHDFWTYEVNEDGEDER